METGIAIIVLLSSSFFDALRDTHNRKDWWAFHWRKWISWYPPLAFILYLHVDRWFWLPVIVAAYAIWRLGAIAGGQGHWPSFWGRWFR
jgi:hypothetical protein